MLKKYSEQVSSQLKILIIDDVGYMRAIIKEMLNALQLCNIVEAQNGKEALALIKQQHFSLVLCDWNMPKLSGIALLQAIRISHATVTLPFLMVTSNKKLCDVKQSIQSGVSGFLVKPFDLDALAKQIDDLYDDVLLHQKTVPMLSKQLLRALDEQDNCSVTIEDDDIEYTIE
ncbi:MAG: response regulator [Psychrobium sp.]|nr:response regulator [Psychrobium sp.]